MPKKPHHKRLSRISGIANGWDVCIITITLIIAVSIWDSDLDVLDWLPALVIILGWYIVVGRHAAHDSTGPWALIYSIGVIPLLFGATWMNPWLGYMQLPLMLHMWRVLLPNRHRAIVLTILLTAAQGCAQAAYSFSAKGRLNRTEFQTIIVCAVIPPIVAIGSVLVCLWLERIFRWGEKRFVFTRNAEEARTRQVALERESATMAERERLAQEVHDTIAQDLAGLRLLTEQARRQMTHLLACRPKDRTDSACESLSSNLDVIASAVDEALGQTRGLIATTMPISSESSLVEAVKRITTRFSYETGIETKIDVTDAHLPRDAEVVFVRCLQEGLSNVRKHSQATHVTVSVIVSDGAAIFTLTDNGIGIGDVPETDIGYGLPGMRQRVELVGGTFSIGSQGRNKGTTVKVSMPLRDAQQQRQVVQDFFEPDLSVSQQAA